MGRLKECGMHRKLDILLISSGTPTDNSPKMAFDMVDALTAGGHVTDLLLKYPVKREGTSTISVYPESAIFQHKVINGLKRRLNSILNRILPKQSGVNPIGNYYFFTTNEEKPPVKIPRILRKINKDYDLVLIFFWQGMLTSKSVFEIYKKTKAPVFFIAADMFPMTGGCSYFWDCRNFETGCGFCPALSSKDKNDITSKIFKYKKAVYENIDCTFLGNNWMIEHAKKSGLFANFGTVFPVIDHNLFRPKDKNLLKGEYNFSGKLVLFVGSVNINEERKGFVFLVEALRKATEKRPDLRDRLLLVAAGGASVDLESYFDFEVVKTGYLTFEQLASYYALSDIYLSATIQDAGPMMVNQALMCGTPVVAFNIGTALDVVVKETGYLAKYKDTDDFASGILKLLAMSLEEKEKMSQKCREIALQTCSYEAFERHIYEAFERSNSKATEKN